MPSRPLRSRNCVVTLPLSLSLPSQVSLSRPPEARTYSGEKKRKRENKKGGADGNLCKNLNEAQPPVATPKSAGFSQTAFILFTRRGRKTRRDRNFIWIISFLNGMRDRERERERERELVFFADLIFFQMSFSFFELLICANNYHIMSRNYHCLCK